MKRQPTARSAEHTKNTLKNLMKPTPTLTLNSTKKIKLTLSTLYISNAAFYFCAAKKVKELEGQKLFKALGKVEAEHASVWKKILKLDSIPEGDDPCSDDYQEDLKDSHARETRAIEFYKKAAAESENARVKEIFEAFVAVEIDHLKLSEERIKKE
jgi:rubrerythrin